MLNFLTLFFDNEDLQKSVKLVLIRLNFFTESKLKFCTFLYVNHICLICNDLVKVLNFP